MFYLSRLRANLAVFLVLLCGTMSLNYFTATARAASVSELTPEQSIASAVTAFQEIGVLRRESPINAEAIAAKYSGELQALAQQADATASLNLDNEILAAIEDIRNDNEPELATQVIDKAVQHVFFQIILNHITAVRDDFEGSTTEQLQPAWDGAVAAFQAIKGTAARDNKVLTADKQSIETGSNPGLDVQIEEAFARGRTALNKANPTEDKITVAVERQVIRLSLVRAYYIGVLREVEGVISNRDRAIGEAREKQKEGEIFYGIIESFVAQDNSVGNVLIKKQFTENISNVVADEIVSELSKGFMGRVKAELSGNEESMGNDRGHAIVEAEEALLYANVFQPDLALRLGENVSTDLNNALNALKVASRDNNASGASDARQAITSILENYEGQLLLAEYSKTSEIAFVDVAVSAMQSIGVLRRQSPVDANAIAAEYAGELQQLTQIVDQLFALNMNVDIVNAITDIGNNNRIDLAVQVIDKTLQRVMALVIYNRMNVVHDQFNDLSVDDLALEWDRAYAAYLAIMGTMGRENKVLTADRLSIETGSDPDIDGDMTAAFIRGKKLITNGGDQAALANEKDIILLSAVRGFLIGVLREVEGIITSRDREVAEAEEKQVEGEFFYAIVRGFVAQHNPSGDARIMSQLTGNLNAVVADDVVSDISRGLLGFVNENLVGNAANIGAERDQAMNAAEKVSLYMNIMLPDLKLRLDALKLATVNNALQDLKEASDVGDITKADHARQTLTTISTEYANKLK